MSNVAIVGSGPAALMAAEVISSAGHRVSIFEKKNGPALKLLIAGSSGLNITHHLPMAEFIQQYTGAASFWRSILADFSPAHWRQFIERELSIKTFEGGGRRFFVEGMKALKLLRTWRKRL